MNTIVLKPTPDALTHAGRLIASGQLVAFPTETVYGLGADATNAQAVNSIFAAKGRPGDNPLIVHISALAQLEGVISGNLPDNARKLADAYWPGPLTMILPKGARIPREVSAGLDSVGVRLPDNDVARAMIDAAGVPVAAPSANISGKPSPTTAAHVFADMNGRIPLILDGGACGVGLESTVVDVRTSPARVLRPGGVTPHMIADVLGECEVDGSVLRPLREGEDVRSPGMKYRHYAPDGAMVIVKGARENVARAICHMYDASEGAKCVLALEANLPLYGARAARSLGKDAMCVAAELFKALREMDEKGVRAIFAEAVPAEGMGLAVMNRLGRAAAFHVVDADAYFTPEAGE